MQQLIKDKRLEEYNKYYIDMEAVKTPLQFLIHFKVNLTESFESQVDKINKIFEADYL